MKNNLEEAIDRLDHWVSRNADDELRRELVRDVALVVEAAKISAEAVKCRIALKVPLESILLSEEFLKKFVAAFARTPLPTTLTTGRYDGPGIKGVPACSDTSP